MMDFKAWTHFSAVVEALAKLGHVVLGRFSPLLCEEKLLLKGQLASVRLDHLPTHT